MKDVNDISKRQELYQNDTSDISLKINDIFKNPSERSFFLVTRKTEKIVTALYLITDVMGEDLPLTQSIRSESLDLLNACYRFLSSSIGMNPHEMSRIAIRLEHVLSLVSIGKITHHISEMNAQVLSVELEKVIQVVTGELADIRTKQATYNGTKEGALVLTQPALPSRILSDMAFDEMIKNRKRQNDIKTTLTTFINDTKKDPVLKTNQNDIPKIKTTHPVSLEKRKQKIIEVITSHKNATMQDIQKFVTDCSDKTLQRELVSLIGLGMIRKEGDKRWATYHIV